MRGSRRRGVPFLVSPPITHPSNPITSQSSGDHQSCGGAAPWRGLRFFLRRVPVRAGLPRTGGARSGGVRERIRRGREKGAVCGEGVGGADPAARGGPPQGDAVSVRGLPHCYPPHPYLLPVFHLCTTRRPTRCIFQLNCALCGSVCFGCFAFETAYPPLPSPTQPAPASFRSCY